MKDEGEGTEGVGSAAVLGRGRSANGPQERSRRITQAQQAAYELFDRGESLERVAARLGRAVSTTRGYLQGYIRDRRPARITPWVSDEVYDRVAEALRRTGGERLTALHEFLSGRVDWAEIRLVTAHLALRGAEDERST